MFDYKILINRTEFIPYEKTIIEKRAPTDESIRLWNEIKEKAYATIRDTIRLKTLNPNSMEATIDVIGAGRCIGCGRIVYIDHRIVFHLPQHKRLCPKCYEMLCVVG